MTLAVASHRHAGHRAGRTAVGGDRVDGGGCPPAASGRPSIPLRFSATVCVPSPLAVDQGTVRDAGKVLLATAPVEEKVMTPDAIWPLVLVTSPDFGSTTSTAQVLGP